MNDLNWVSELAPRVARTIEKVVAEVKGAIQNVHELWHRIRVVLTDALRPYPEAQMAVSRAIEAEFIAK
jgi:hypothetical protein